MAAPVITATASPRVSPGHAPISLLASPEEWHAPDVGFAWASLLQATGHPGRLFQTPEWLDNKFATKRHESPTLACLRGDDGRIVGVAPVNLLPVSLKVSVRSFTFWESAPLSAQILGHQPLLPDEPEVHNRFWTALLGALPGCACASMRVLPMDSFCYRHLSASPALREHFLTYTTRRSWNHFITLPETYDEYLGRFRKKKRRDLQREVRQFRELGGGVLRLQRVESEADVPAFLADAERVARAAWQRAYRDNHVRDTPKWRVHLSDLAARGLLRSYVLYCGERACAYGLGSQHGDMYYYDETGFDPGYTKHAPGKIQLLLMVEDLIGHRPARRFNFGFGDEDYKREFGDSRNEVASVILFRKNLRNRIRRGAHASYRALADALAARGRRKPVATEGEGVTA